MPSSVHSPAQRPEPQAAGRVLGLVGSMWRRCRGPVGTSIRARCPSAAVPLPTPRWHDVPVVPILLERQAELQVLGAALDSAARGRGSAALVLGEAGIGKTTLVRAFVDGLPDRPRVLAGACEDLCTPRALGPLRDAAPAGSPLADALQTTADPDAVFDALLTELAAPPGPTVLVIEDAHWADSATIDVLRYLSRRVESLAAVVLVTYRDDLARDHP